MLWAKSACFHLILALVWVVFVQLPPTNIFRLERRLHCSPLLSTASHFVSSITGVSAVFKFRQKKIWQEVWCMKAKQSKSVQTLMRMLCSVSILAVGCHTAPQVWSIVHEDYQYLTNSFAHTWEHYSPGGVFSDLSMDFTFSTFHIFSVSQSGH